MSVKGCCAKLQCAWVGWSSEPDLGLGRVGGWVWASAHGLDHQAMIWRGKAAGLPETARRIRFDHEPGDISFSSRREQEVL